MSTFALRSTRVLLSSGEAAVVVKINGQFIEAVLPYDAALDCPIEDLGELVLMPGLVDTHVHINEPGRCDWEGFETATQAAAAGGITTIVDMPLNCIPVTTTKAALDEKLAAVAGKLWVDCGFWGGVIPSNIDDLDELLAAGVLGVKSFLIDSGIDEFPNVDRDDLRRAMPIVAKHKVPYLIHAELDSGLDLSDSNRDSSSYLQFLESRPKSWEIDAIKLMIDLAASSGEGADPCHIHIVHLSCADALSNIKHARQQGLSITVETCPHYLTLAAENINDGETLFKCCPPIREQANNDLLWQGLEDHAIDFIVSDHSPCTTELKLQTQGDIENAWGGIAALQFGLSLIWTEAKERGISLHEVNRLMSTATSNFIGLSEIKGSIKAGYLADLVIFNDEVEYVITKEMIKHKNKVSPYVGKEVSGAVERTYLRGQIVYNGKAFSEQALGKPLLKMTK